MRIWFAAFVILVFAHVAQARISPPEMGECADELTKLKLTMTSLYTDAPLHDFLDAEAQVRRMFDRFTAIGFPVPNTLEVYLVDKDEFAMAWSIYTQPIESLHLPPHAPLRAHKIAYLALDRALWNDREIKVMADLRRRVAMLDEEDDAVLASMVGLSMKDERYRTLERERRRLEGLFHKETHAVFEDKGYLGSLLETFVDIAAFADTGDPKISREPKEDLIKQFGDELGEDLWRARDFSAILLPDEWGEANHYRELHRFFSPVRSYVGQCLRNASQEERFAYLKIFYRAMRDVLNEKFDLYGNHLDKWAGSVVDENKRMISQLLEYGGCR
jgi:hypothetical protein